MKRYDPENIKEGQAVELWLRRGEKYKDTAADPEFQRKIGVVLAANHNNILVDFGENKNSFCYFEEIAFFIVYNREEPIELEMGVGKVITENGYLRNGNAVVAIRKKNWEGKLGDEISKEYEEFRPRHKDIVLTFSSKEAIDNMICVLNYAKSHLNFRLDKQISGNVVKG